jgi:hypothetical protein
LSIQPNNRQAMSLKSLAEEKVAKDGLIGMMIVGGAAAAVVSIDIALLFNFHNLSSPFSFLSMYFDNLQVSGALLLLKAKR